MARGKHKISKRFGEVRHDSGKVGRRSARVRDLSVRVKVWRDPFQKKFCAFAYVSGRKSGSGRLRLPPHVIGRTEMPVPARTSGGDACGKTPTQATSEALRSLSKRVAKG